MAKTVKEKLEDMSFTVKRIIRVEQKLNKTLQELMQSPSVRFVVLMIGAGLNVDDEKAESLLEGAIAERMGYFQVQEAIYEALVAQGFFGDETKETLEKKALERQANQNS